MEGNTRYVFTYESEKLSYVEIELQKVLDRFGSSKKDVNIDVNIRTGNYYFVVKIFNWPIWKEDN